MNELATSEPPPPAHGQAMIDDPEQIVYCTSQQALDRPPTTLTPSEPPKPPQIDSSAVAAALQVYATPEVADAIQRLHQLVGTVKDAPAHPPNSTHNKRTALQHEEDLVLMLPLVARRKTLRQIADWLAGFRPYRLSFQMIGLDVKIVKQRLQDSGKASLDLKRALELEHIRQQEEEAYAAWEKSKEDQVSVTKINDPVNPAKSKTMVKKTKTPGDPKWMKALIELRAQRMILEGTAMPVKAIPEFNASVDERLLTENMREAYRRRLVAKEKHANVIPMKSEKVV